MIKMTILKTLVVLMTNQDVLEDSLAIIFHKFPIQKILKREQLVQQKWNAPTVQLTMAKTQSVQAQNLDVNHLTTMERK